MKVMKKLISCLLVLAMLGGICACKKSDSDDKKSKKTKKTATTKVIDTEESIDEIVAIPAVAAVEEVVLTSTLGVTAKFPDYLGIPSNADLTVTKLDEASDPSIGAVYTDYDINLGDLHELGGFIELRLPYDDSTIAAGQDPAKCVAAMYYNETDSVWESVLYQVDTATKELVIFTDHFSHYRCIVFEDEGKRSAQVVCIFDRINALSFDEAQVAVEEYLDEGAPGNHCRAVVAPILEDAFRGYVEDSGDASSYVGNIVTALCTLTDGEGAYSYMPNSQTVTEYIGRVGLYMAASTFIIGVTGSYIQDDYLMNLYKELAYQLSASKQTGSMGNLVTGAWIINDAMRQADDFSANFVKEEETRAYRYYMNSDDYDHCYLSTRDWKDTINSIATTPLSDKSEFDQNPVITEIDDYCNDFWTLTADDRAEVYKDVGQKGRDDPDDDMKQAITDEYKDELLEDMNDIFDGLEYQFKYQSMDLALACLCALNKYFNTEYVVDIVEVVEADEQPRYAGCTAVFAPLAAGADDEDWWIKLDDTGSARTTMTWIGYVLAGEPYQLQVFDVESDPAEAKPILVKPFALNDPYIELKYEGVALEDLIGTYNGSFRLAHVELTDEGFEYYKSNPGDLADYDIDMSNVTKADCDATINALIAEQTATDIPLEAVYVDSADPASGQATITICFQSNDSGQISQLPLYCQYDGATFTITGMDSTVFMTNATDSDIEAMSASGIIGVLADGGDLFLITDAIILTAQSQGINMAEEYFALNVMKN